MKNTKSLEKRKQELKDEEKALKEKLAKIQEEQREIKEQELSEKKEQVAKKIQYMRDNREVVLSLLKHDRTSCSDENPCNGLYSSDNGPRCQKCFLIEILNGDYIDGEYDIDFSVNIFETNVF